MRVKDLFKLKYGVNLELIRCEETESPNGVNFVARTSLNNGVVARVKLIENVKPQAAGTLSCATSGSVLSTFVQTEPYYSGRDLYVLIPKISLSLEQKLFYAMILNKNAFRYSYGRAANKTLGEIEIPSLEECNKIVGAYKVKEINSVIKRKESSVNIQNWRDFKVGDIFLVKKTANINYDDLLGDGKVNYVTRTTKNNSVEKKVSGDGFKLNEGNCLTIGGEGAGVAYQETDFLTGNNITIIKNKHLNKFNALFLVTLLTMERFRYSYGRAFNRRNVDKTILKLPVTPQGEPDWQYMESYIKSMPYSDLI